jgi:hypothetical protein
MELGDLVLYQGKPYYLRGLEPMSVPDRRAFLEAAFTSEECVAPLAELEGRAADGPQRTAEV